MPPIHICNITPKAPATTLFLFFIRQKNAGAKNFVPAFRPARRLRSMAAPVFSATRPCHLRRMHCRNHIYYAATSIARGRRANFPPPRPTLLQWQNAISSFPSSNAHFALQSDGALWTIFYSSKSGPPPPKSPPEFLLPHHQPAGVLILEAETNHVCTALEGTQRLPADYPTLQPLILPRRPSIE